MSGPTWGEPDATPLEDVRRWIAEMRFTPMASSLYMSRRVYVRLATAVSRASMTKRQFRRWRARFRADMRQQDQELKEETLR